ncbi:MAG: SDR family oxidoreductase [Methanospirillum sp.]|nr:SDR family oxidoreductase [Methanospirillum sp.]
METGDYYQKKVCIVTGANSGIGYALSEELLKRGATVYLLGRNAAKVAEAAGKLAAHGDRVRTLVADVTDGAQMRAAVEGAAAEAGRLDLLFNNAGVGLTVPFERIGLDEMRAVIDANLWSVLYGTHAAVPIMLRQGSGQIVSTSSIGGLIPVPFQSLYNTTKFAVTGLSESLRYEYAARGISFSAVCPFFIASAIFSKGLDGSTGDQGIPAGAYPADRAAAFILDRVAERQGIIVVPEEPFLGLWREYANGDPGMEAFMLETARMRGQQVERGETPTAVPPLPP